jgi:phospho-N-acetylmuramoyl-pentapeptide-transferase
VARIIGLAFCASILLSYWLIELSDQVSIFNVFRYITFRTGAAIVTALVFMLLFLTLIRSWHRS